MPRPICNACGGVCIDPVTAVEVRGPDRPAAAFVVCSDCALELVRRLGKGSKAIPIGKGCALEPVGSARDD